MSRSSLAALALCGTLFASCGSAREASRVGIEKDQTSITFGFTPAKAKTGPLKNEAALGDIGTVDSPVSETPIPTATFSPSFQQSSQQFSSGPCPSADPNAPIASRASTEITGRPRVGTYKWLGSGKMQISSATAPFPSFFAKNVLASKDFTDSTPRSAGQPAGDNFTYATLEPRVDRGVYWRFSWQVKTDPGVAQDPEGGLVLEAIEDARADGSPDGTYFQAQNSGLLLAPFPIKPGQSWQSASVDVARVHPMQINGQVLKREVVDACGTLVEGWHIHATLNDAGQNATLDYLIATQYGGMLIALNVDGPYLGVTFDSVKTRAGQVTPKPLPKGMK